MVTPGEFLADRLIAEIARPQHPFAYPQWTLGIEMLGWDPHSGKVNWEKDLRRRTYLQSHGWLILEFTWNDVTKRRDYVIETIQRAISTRSLLAHPHVP